MVMYISNGMLRFLESNGTGSASANTAISFLLSSNSDDQKKLTIDAIAKIAAMTKTELNALDGQLADAKLKSVPDGYGIASSVNVDAVRRLVELRKGEIQRDTETWWKLLSLMGAGLGFTITAGLQVYELFAKAC